MYRFFVTPEQVNGNQILITGEDVNHIKNVLRMKPGEQVRISDGESMEYFCQVKSLEEAQVVLAVERSESFTTELPARIILYQGLPKGDKMELIIQKAVELGVHQIVPVSMKRCIMKLDEKKAANKVKRWNAIAESAAKQSKRSVVPEVTMPVTMQQVMRESDQIDWKLFPYESENGMEGIRSLMTALKAAVVADPESCPCIGILIGPEGGFDSGEVEKAVEHGWESISLGSRILRTETAGMATLAMLTYVLEP